MTGPLALGVKLNRWILPALCAALMAGCGGDDAEETGEVTSDADVESRLITIDELPSGWATDPREQSEETDLPECLEPPEDGETTLEAEAEASFARGEVPQLGQTVQRYEPGTAGGAFARARERIDSCGTFDMEVEGEEVEARIGQLSFPAFGDETAAWQLAFTYQAFNFTGTIVAIREGDYSTILLYTDLGQPSMGDLEDLVELAVGKL